MNLTKMPWMLGLLSGLLALGCSGTQDRRGEKFAVTGDDQPSSPRAALDDDRDDGEEVELALVDVPNVVRQAALTAVPGLVLEEAERETENGTVVYSLEGRANGKAYEVEVTAGGRVLDVEQGDDDDDGDDADRDDDDKDDD